ncbi:MAG: T9SS type A sorting domain-containing protein [Lewinellaceae bacterium]|nr:T9SS type A sorting domain-containing protein [Lewinellaceae bacterium]MCB9355239.1 T9SS type A sorting domain-containing protein [Lewinellaceae bacterium]
MKKAFLLLTFIVAASIAATAQIVVSGNITANTTWTKNNVYLLSGFVYVKNDATLTIEPGTVIKGDKNTKGSLIVTRGCKIVASGTPDEPIVFTSNEATPTYGDWGGVIICGKAPTNASNNGVDGEGLVEGGVGELYGGNDPMDNSGVLRYVRIEYAGIAFQPNNEINGLTMGGVGAGTTIEYVQVSYANDDAFEWFGGTVNCKYLIAYRALDDDFDCDFGYSGNIQFAYSQRDPAVADISGSNGFEIDNDGSGTNRTPKTAPTFSNVTIVGPTGTFDPNFKRGNHLRRNSEPGVYNSVFIGAYPDAGLLIDGDSCAQNALNGKLVVKNSFYHGMPTQLKTNVATFDIATWATANEISTGPNSSSAGLKDPFNLNTPDPRPQSTSPVLGYAKFEDARIANANFIPVSYAGAFSASGDWTAKWSRFGDNLNQVGLAPAQEVVVSGNISTNTTWTADKVYVLSGFVYVKNCAELTIEPGTIIKGDKATKGALIVTRCAKIIADGTVDLPIVFSTNDPEPTYGSWGGIIICGQAPTNTSYLGVQGEGLIEGGVGELYGGNDPMDNSGILRYVRIEYPGIAFQPNNEINGLTMGGVGAGTIIDHVQVSYSGDDSYEWFGGTVNCKHLIAYRGLDDDFDCDFGYSGSVQYAFSVRDPQVADISGSNGFEIDNDGNGSTNTPKTKPTFSNVTIVGPDPAGPVDALYKRAGHLRRNSEPGIFNSVLIGKYEVGFLIDGNACADNATNNLLEIKNTVVAGPTTLLSTNASNGFNVDTWFNTAAFGNKTFATSAGSALQDPFNLDLPNAQPTYTSPAIGAGAFTAARINNSFFDKVDYAGAFDGTNDWTCGWAVYKELNINCLVETNNVEKYISAVKLFPTVASSQATLQLSLTNPADLSVEIYDLNGRFFGQQISEKATAGEQQYTLNTAQLDPGFYFVRIQAGDAVKTEKLIIVR